MGCADFSCVTHSPATSSRTSSSSPASSSRHQPAASTYIKAFVSDRTCTGQRADVERHARDLQRAARQRLRPRPRPRSRTTRTTSSSSSSRPGRRRTARSSIGDLMPHTTKDIDADVRASCSEMLGSIQNRHLAAHRAGVSRRRRADGRLLQGAGGDELSPRVHRRAARAHAQRDRSRRRDRAVLSRASTATSSSPASSCTTSPRPGSCATTAPSATPTAGSSSGTSSSRACGSSTRRRTPRRCSASRSRSELIDVLQHIILSHHGKCRSSARRKSPAHAGGDRGAHDREHGREADDVARRLPRRATGARGELDRVHEGVRRAAVPPGRCAGRMSSTKRQRRRQTARIRRRRAADEDQQPAVRDVAGEKH